MKPKYYKIQFILFGLLTLLTSCEDMVTLDSPGDKLIREEVFNNEVTAKSALKGIYNELFQSDFSNGFRNSITLLAGLSADNIRNITTYNVTRMEFQQNDILPDNPENLNIWSSAYNMIYLTNAFLEGIATSENLDQEVKEQMDGQARFVRAFTYFYLVNLYGDVPLVLNTDYRDNQLVSRTSKISVYDQIITDLEVASEEVPEDYKNGERTWVNKFAVKALLARVYLYMEDWAMAEQTSSEVIQRTDLYEILPDLNSVFLANSKEAIWQISPIGGGGIMTNTYEGNLFIIDPIFSFFASIQLEDDFVETFKENDLRLSNWIGFNVSKNAYFPFKYKIRSSMDYPIKEYSMVLRLAEQYLIRAEALARLGKITDAVIVLDVIRSRAGLEPIAEQNPGIGQEELLDEIIIQRRKELFVEWGHRWFDLKRIGKAGEVLGAGNPIWDSTDLLYPIPEEERKKNPNLSQNEGY